MPTKKKIETDKSRILGDLNLLLKMLGTFGV